MRKEMGFSLWKFREGLRKWLWKVLCARGFWTRRKFIFRNNVESWETFNFNKYVRRWRCIFKKSHLHKGSYHLVNYNHGTVWRVVIKTPKYSILGLSLGFWEENSCWKLQGGLNKTILWGILMKFLLSGKVFLFK